MTNKTDFYFLIGRIIITLILLVFATILLNKYLNNWELSSIIIGGGVILCAAFMGLDGGDDGHPY